MKTRSVPIGEVCAVVGGGTPARNVAEYYGGSIPWVTPKDMKTWEIRDAQVNITESGLQNSATRLVPRNSVLVVVRSGVLKHTLPVAINRVPVAINQDMKALLCSESADPDYVARFIKARSPVILQWVRATTADNFPIDKLKCLDLPLPPFPEQQRIAAILDKADALRAKRRAALAKLDTLTQSIFLDMFGDPVMNPKGWPKKPFGQVCETRLGKMLDQKQQTGKHRRPYLRNANVQWFRFDLSGVFEMDFDEDDRRILKLQPGDLLICEGGEPGRAAVWQGELQECYFQKALHRARPNKKLAVPEYLCWLLWFLSQGRKLTGVTSATIAHLTGEKLSVLPTLLPSPELQLRFTEILRSIQAVAQDQLAGLRNLDALFCSLQHRAFQGEL